MKLLKFRSMTACALALVIAWPQGYVVHASSPRQDNAAKTDNDGGWPRVSELASGTATMYQPQIADWTQQRHVVAWAALTYKPKGAAESTPGTVKIEADTNVAVEDRLVRLGSVRITETKFPSLSKEQLRDLIAGLEALPEKDRVISLDRMTARLEESQIRPNAGDSEGLKADPPPIFYSTVPAVFVPFDSQPVWSPIPELDLKYAVNTNWDVFQQPSTNTLFIRNEKVWLKAQDLFGPWSPAGKLPPAFNKLPNDANWTDVRANLPGQGISEKNVPRVFVSYEPAELILLDGEPELKQVTGTSLYWVENTESDLFRLGKTGDFYFLVAGRWFSALNLAGPWTFATPHLPPDFLKIPLDHPRSRVLASVPGTDQAAEAVLLAQIPRTAKVNRSDLKAPEVAYQGDPQFQPIDGTSLSRAANTDKDIVKLGDLYYMCFQGVWFMSRQATGPWEVATSIPAEIYKIPASSPVHNVTYVTVEKDDDPDDEWVTFAYVAAYTGVMIGWGCAVWGTGWYYPPYVWYGGFYPGYYYRPVTYGMGAWYNPWTGSYGRSAVAYGPYGGAGVAASYNPRTGTYTRGATAYGPYSSRTFAEAYNPGTGAYARTNQGSNVYGNWGSSSVQRGDDWVRTAHATRYGQGSVSGIQTSAGGGAISRTGADGRTTVGRTGSGDVFAGHDGNVYRNQDGQWQQWDNGSWNNTARPEQRPENLSGATQNRNSLDSGTLEQLNRDQRARSSGSQRTQDYGTYRSGGFSTRGAGSFRGGGGRRR